jgi:exopolyphosphatase/guanosine-5'-triphosphate,3'-diphosphate pyrophosphatase
MRHVIVAQILSHPAADGSSKVSPAEPEAERPRNGWSLAGARRQAVLELAAALDPEPAHGRQVARLALELFDKTREVHDLGGVDRELLEYAALLHDVGASVNRSKHHRHSRYLILHSTLPGFEREEVRIVAAIARFHRGAPPKPNQESLEAFEDDVRRRVVASIAILRIADALDRSHQSVVRGLRVVRGHDRVELQLDAGGENAMLELWAAQRRADFWRRCFGVDVETRVRRVRQRPRAVKSLL